ncbi:MAG: response regulator [Bacteroidota bacterium]
MKKILVVEDSAVVNQHICVILKNAGYQTVSAFKGSEALEKIKTQKFDLALLDLMMETPDAGLIAGRKLSVEYHLPIVFLTALTDDKTMSKALDLFPYGYIIKPFDEMSLLTTIRVAILKSQSEKVLVENNEVFHSILESVDQYIVLSIDGKIKYANRKFEDLTGMNFKELTEKDLDSLFSVEIVDQNSSGELISLSDTLGEEDVFNIYANNKKIEKYFGDHYLNEFNVGSEHTKLIVFKDVTDRVHHSNFKEQMRLANIKSFVDGQEKERVRIAVEIHDSLGQLLNLIKLKMKAANIMDQEILHILDQAVDETVRISENMLPRKILNFPLTTCISLLTDTYNSDKVNVHFNYSDIPAIDNQVIKTNIYRIVQEALNNSIKYSKCENIFIQMNKQGSNVSLTIEDDGIGFENTERTGNGLSNMKMRATAIGGDLKIESQKNVGTLVICELPIKKMLEEEEPEEQYQK